MDAVYIIMIVLFTIELILNSYAVPGFPCRLYFWLDAVSLVSLFFDVSIITNALFFNESHLDSETNHNSDGVKDARASRAARIGARATKMVKLIRMVRLARLARIFKIAQYAQQRKNNFRQKSLRRLSVIAADSEACLMEDKMMIEGSKSSNLWNAVADNLQR